MTREDRFTNTPEQAAAYEARRGQADDPDDRPTLAECIRDEADDPRACPECEQGKHQGCDNVALDQTTDTWVPCPCFEAGHGAPDVTGRP